MSKSFEIVEEKLREAAFFLDALTRAKMISEEARFYFSAFVSASRSVTFAMQASLKGVAGFQTWYAAAQQRLKTDPLAPLFVELRNEVVHVGSNPLNRVTLEHLHEHLSQQMSAGHAAHTIILPNPQVADGTALVDAVQACSEYFASLVQIVFDCYTSFLKVVDPQWYFTADNFVQMGKTFEDAIEELGFPRSWANGVPVTSDSWRVLRREQPSCQINAIFERYLGTVVLGPDDTVAGEAEV